MLNNTFHENSISIGTIINISSIILSGLGILFNIILISLFISRGEFHKPSKKNLHRRIGLIHSINTYIHLAGILITLLVMCIRTCGGDVNFTTQNEYSISWDCYLLAYLLSLFAAGMYGSCFLQAIFRFYRIMTFNRGRFHTQSSHILFIIFHWLLIIIILLPTFSRSIYISSDHFCLTPFNDYLTSTYISLITAILPVTGIFILYIKIILYMKNHIQTRKQRKRIKNDISIIRRIFLLVIIILQTSTMGIFLWILTFFNTNIHFLFYRLLRFSIIISMIICSITLLILSPQLKRTFKLIKHEKTKKKTTTSNNIEDGTPIKTLPNSQT